MNYIIRHERYNDVDIYKIKHDVNGNPRYAIWRGLISLNSKLAIEKGLEVGFTKCRQKQLKDFLVCYAYSAQEVWNKIQQAKKLLPPR